MPKSASMSAGVSTCLATHQLADAGCCPFQGLQHQVAERLALRLPVAIA